MTDSLKKTLACCKQVHLDAVAKTTKQLVERLEATPNKTINKIELLELIAEIEKSNTQLVYPADFLEIYLETEDKFICK